MKELCTVARKNNIEPVTAFLNEILEGTSCPSKDRVRLDIAVDEIFSNISNYAYRGREESGPVRFRVEVLKNPVGVKLCFLDSGVPYNPLDSEKPDIGQPADKREIGGLGIFMVKEMMDRMEYEYRDGQNVLTLVKWFGDGSPEKQMKREDDYGNHGK